MIPAFQSHSETSRLAALSMYERASTLQRILLDWLEAKGGLTDEEMQTISGIPPSTQRPRRIELVGKGLVRDSGAKRKTVSGRQAVVWEIVIDGR